ncbi:MAG TPA: signal peptidase I [Pyrinomonadaceae bacterium]|jgi:signal peptidase I|nr:signal peptidase I [Pyrinomonadaceae bacterium]
MDDATKTAEPSATESKETDKPSISRVSRNGKETPTPAEVKSTGPKKSLFREYYESAVVTVVMALFGMTFIVQAVKVPTGSMENTITIGDHLLVNKFIFAPGKTLPFLPQRNIRRGDIIVFKYPGNKYNPESDFNRPDNKPITTNYVKRVIGLPGDRIEIDGQNVIVNGKALPEHRIEAVDHGNQGPLEILNVPPRKADDAYDVYWDSKRPEDSYPTFKEEGNGKEIVVPADHYFVMGDNRSNSLDSRYWGFVPRDLIIGRAMFVYWSYDESAPSTGNVLSNFIKNTRWARTGTMVK